jgi:hypothetical protein
VTIGGVRCKRGLGKATSGNGNMGELGDGWLYGREDVGGESPWRGWPVLGIDRIAAAAARWGWG